MRRFVASWGRFMGCSPPVWAIGGAGVTDRRGLRIGPGGRLHAGEGLARDWPKGTGQSMNDATNQRDGGPSDRGDLGNLGDRAEVANVRDVVMTRLLDGRASSAQWRELRSWTEKDAAGREDVWDDLIAQSEQSDALAMMVGDAAARAERMGAAVPEVAGVIVRGSSERDGRDGAAHGRGGSDRLGWLVAAVLAVGFVAFAIRSGPIERGATMSPELAGTGRVAGGTAQAGLGSGLSTAFSTGLTSPDDAMSEYLRLGQQRGQVLGELPQRVVLQARELGDGKGQEVLYLRQIVERAVVKDMYKLGRNDVGEAVMVPMPDWASPTAIDDDDQHEY
jgi:hypothetical protein